MYRAVIFDLDNTLLNYEQSERESLQTACCQLALFEHKDFTWDQFWNIYAPINTRYWNDRFQNGLSGLDILEVSMKETLDYMINDSSKAPMLAKTYWNLFCHTYHYEQGAKETITGLINKYQLGIISNGLGEAQRKRLSVSQLIDYFQSIVISDEVGFAKPQKEIFDHALADIGYDRHEVLFVGDSLSLDYEGAQNAGIDFCYYNRDLAMIPASIQPKFTIYRLIDLNDLLKRGA